VLSPLVALGCAHGEVTRKLVSARPPVDATLGPGDVFDVRVFEEPDLSGSYRVDPEGAIDYPMIGRVIVAGKLPGQIADQLTDKLRVYVRKPAVSVFVKEVNSKRVIVYGQVAKPGTFPYADAMTISQAISLAGGFAAMAQREHVTILRFERDKQRSLTVDLRAISDGRLPNQFVLPGDEIYVPERMF
jgi:protein involved in polysaccharide export with SLBB domain